MVVSRSDTKRRRKEDVALSVVVEAVKETSPKRAKVHAQRKFAQGSGSVSSPSVTPVKDKTKANDAAPPPKFIPSNRPKTEDFLTFLCFRGTSTLPARLDFFNIASLEDGLDDEEGLLGLDQSTRDSARNSRVSSSTISSSRKPRPAERNGIVQQNAVPPKSIVALAKNTKKKPDVAVQALKKKYQDQRMAKQRVTSSLNKLAQKVKGKNMVRTRSSGPQVEVVLEEKLRTPKKEPVAKKKKPDILKTPSPPLKRSASSSSKKRGGLRSGGQPPTPVSKLKREKTRQKLILKSPSKQCKAKISGKPFISSLSDFSSDDDQPLLKKARLVDKAAISSRRNFAQKVKKRYAKHLPKKRLKPQILTRSQKQINALKAERKAEEKKLLKEAKERDALANKLRLAEEKKKEQELKAKLEKEVKEMKEKAIRDAKEKEKHDLKVKEDVRKERERILESVKIEMKEKEISATKELEKKMRDKRSKDSPAVANVSTRPSRKTKEAAAFYMEMLGKRLIGDHHDDDDDDDLFSVSSFPELPNARRNEQREKEIKAKAKDKNVSSPVNKNGKTTMSPLAKSDGCKTNEEAKSKLTKKKPRQVNENKDLLVVLKKEEISSKEAISAKNAEPSVAIIKNEEKQEDEAPPSTRRRSLRTGPFQLHDYGSDTTEKKAKSKSKKSASSYFSPSESFSDSDEEPLGKLALRRQSSSEKTVLNDSALSAEEKPASKPRKAREVPSGGMKGALRESITHTPFKFRQKSVTPKGAKAKNLEMDFKDVVDSLSIQLEERAQKASIKAAKKAVVAQQKASALAGTKKNTAISATESKVDVTVEKPSTKDFVADSHGTKETTVDLNVAGRSALPQKTESIVNKNNINVETSADNLEMHLAIQTNQRNTKGKVNMSMEQIEKWLSDSCRVPKPKQPDCSQQRSYELEQLSYRAETSKQAISPKSKIQQPQFMPQDIKAASFKGLRETIPSYASVMKHVKSSQIRIPSYKQSLNQAIKESIKDSESINNRNRTPEKNAISPAKDISPISNLSISTTGISVLGESLSFGIGSRSSDDFSLLPHAERTPEKKPIFIHGRTSHQKVRQRKNVKPSVNAFSPDNESSVYAFDNDPEPLPMSKPFRRQNTRDSRPSSVGTSKSEDDLSKLGLGDDEILPPPLYRTPQVPVDTMKPFNRAASISKSEEYLARKALEKATESDRLLCRSETAHSSIAPGVQQCLPHLRDELTVQIDPPSEVLSSDLNISNTTSNSDEDLSKVRERLLQRRVPLQLSLADRQSASIAVQVNLDTDDDQSPLTDSSFYNQSLECCAQTEEDEDDNNGHLFYIPLAPGAVGANVSGSGMIQGVAVKLGTEGPTGPNQRVIMRAKLVTKPPTFNRSVNTTSHGISGRRSLLGQQSRRPIASLPPDQKSAVGISPGSNGTHPPVGTVQPTSRPQPSPLGQPEAGNKPVSPRPAHPVSGSSQPQGAETKNIAMPPLKVPPPSTSLPHRTPEGVCGFYTEKASANPSRIYAMLPGVNQTLPKAKPQELANVSSGAIKWGFPSMHAKKECKTTYYTQTSDKVLVAKKEAFISAVPPLAPLSYSTKRPAAANNVISKSVVRTAPVCKPSQVPSTVPSESVKESEVCVKDVKKPVVNVMPKPAVEVATVAVKTVVSVPPVDLVPVEDTSVPGPSNVLKNIVKPKRSYKVGKRAKPEAPSTNESDVTDMFPKPGEPSRMVQAPTFYPTEAEFQDPIKYINRIRPIAEKFGICRVVPPANFKPECKVSDDMRFTAYNQYVHKTLHRWGPNVKEMMAIRKYLATQNITLKQPPYIGSIEIDLPRLYQTVQSLGGLKEVILKGRWQRVADEMKISKSAQDRVTKIDDIYCKYLLPYETLSSVERAKLLEEVEASWKEREEKSASRSPSTTEDDEDDDEIDECIVKGRNMALNQFYRTARNTMAMWFKEPEPAASDVETEFWKLVTAGQSHVCVNSGSIESSRWGYGFPVSKNSPFAKHAWNLKVLTNNSGNVLRSIGPIMGVTVPTIHVGMLFTTCCWYRDPHGLPWVEYLHTGASKIWYGIPDECSGQLRSALTKLVPRCVKNKTIWLPSDTAMIPPPLLTENAVSLSRVVQEPGQFIVVFPRAFTSSICTGYLVSESVYFAQPSWLSSSEQVFKDIHGSCEPSMFSLERLLFSISTDTRSSVTVLKQILPMIQQIRDQEITYRKQLGALGLKASDRLKLPETGGKKRKAVVDDDGEYECEVCRANLYVSLVTNGHEEGVYCLPHAVEYLTKHKHQLKFCKLLYTYNQLELTALVQKLVEKIELKGQKRPYLSRPSLTVVK